MAQLGARIVVDRSSRQMDLKAWKEAALVQDDVSYRFTTIVLGLCIRDICIHVK